MASHCALTQDSRPWRSSALSVRTHHVFSCFTVCRKTRENTTQTFELSEHPELKKITNRIGKTTQKKKRRKNWELKRGCSCNLSRPCSSSFLSAEAEESEWLAVVFSGRTNLVVKLEVHPERVRGPQQNRAHAADRKRFQDGDAPAARSAVLRRRRDAFPPLVIFVQQVEGFSGGQHSLRQPQLLYGKQF